MEKETKIILAWRESVDAGPHSQHTAPFSFCAYPVLLTAEAKKRVLQVEAGLQMEQTVVEAQLPQESRHQRHPRDTGIVAPSEKTRLFPAVFRHR